MTGFSLPALLGGALIGLAALLLRIFNHRTAGISGIASGVLTGNRQERGWRLAFLTGLILAPLLYRLLNPDAAITLNAGIGNMLIAGLLVGFGAQLGGGCTSGHGVCGIARGAKRSIAATLTFIASAMLTVWLIRHGFPLVQS